MNEIEPKKKFPLIKFIKACVEFVILLIKLFRVDDEDEK